MKPQLPGRQPGVCAISIAGLGGQGTVLAGVLLGQAAVAAGRWASQTAVYTVAARGGLACSEVLVADAPVSCPLAEDLNVVLALATLGLRHEEGRLVPNGLAILDEGVECSSGKGFRVVALPLSRLATEAGSRQSANLAALGALVALAPVVPADALAGEIQARFRRPEPVAAYWAGYEAAGQYRP
ncbi:MAG: 2-oxoacid:acceptor oxidoreductase family protein [Bacillota bacterium]|nr:2-oxoacid:acceptor oxidoreductase family protein [Bacillota bacterium]